MLGELHDAHKYGDVGADTFAHTIKNENPDEIELLLSLGMAQFTSLKYLYKPKAVWGKMREASAAKDTTTGLGNFRINYQNSTSNVPKWFF